MDKVVRLATILVIVHASLPAMADEDPFLGFFVGDYTIIGRDPDSGPVYGGTAHIELKDDGLLLRHRRGERETLAEGRMEVPSPPGEGRVLRFRWQKPTPMLMSCLAAFDLDNYPRLTCLWRRQDIQPKEPGLEAFFPKK